MMNRKIKFLPLLLALAILLSGCDVWTDFNQGVNPSNGWLQDNSKPTEGELINPFTVTLMCDGEVFIPSQPINVIWNDGYSISKAPVGEDGVAKVGGLDGDYRVTLETMPEGYAYNPNEYYATNSERNIVINLQKLAPIISGTSIDEYDPYHVRNTGVYCVEIEKPGQEVWFEFVPTEAGTYSVESWVDVVADEINPQAVRYTESFAYKIPLGTYDDGGEEGTYTKNFIMKVEMAADYFGEDGVTQASFTYGILASHRNGEYPIKVYIAVKYNGGFSLNHVESKLMDPGELVQQKDYNSSYSWQYPEINVPGGVAELDAGRYRVWPKEEGGDGYYHLYDEIKYAGGYTEYYADGKSATFASGYGPILYADVNCTTRFLGSSDKPGNMATMEYEGNKALTVEQGKENYKLFVEGWSYLNYTNMSYPGQPGVKGPYFCDVLCPCRTSNTCESMVIVGINGSCTEKCTKCLEGCNRCPEELMGRKGYAEMCNQDGRYAVTPELQEFLQKLSIGLSLFFDGEGFAETHPQYPIYATEEDQWLCFCGYYER